MRRLFRRYVELKVAQKRFYSLLMVITLFTLLLYCLGIGSFLLRSRLVPEVAVESLPTFTPSPTLTPTTVLLPGQTPTPTATLPPTPTQRPIPTYTPTPSHTTTPETITMTVVITVTPGVTTTVVVSATVTPTPILTPTVTITAETSLTTASHGEADGIANLRLETAARAVIGYRGRTTPFRHIPFLSHSVLGHCFPPVRAALPFDVPSSLSIPLDALKGQPA